MTRSGTLGGAGGAAVASTASTRASTSASTGSSSSTGGGGGNACPSGLAPPADPSGDYSTSFDTQQEIDTLWTLGGTSMNVFADGDLMIQFLPNDATVYAETNAAFTFGDCAVWVELSTPVVADDVLNRISVANYSIGRYPGNRRHFVVRQLQRRLTRQRAGEDPAASAPLSSCCRAAAPILLGACG